LLWKFSIHYNKTENYNIIGCTNLCKRARNQLPATTPSIQSLEQWRVPYHTETAMPASSLAAATGWLAHPAPVSHLFALKAIYFNGYKQASMTNLLDMPDRRQRASASVGWMQRGCLAANQLEHLRGSVPSSLASRRLTCWAPNRGGLVGWNSGPPGVVGLSCY
jgi:hypothetical protein